MGVIVPFVTSQRTPPAFKPYHCVIAHTFCKATELEDGLLHSGEDRLCNQNQTRRSGNLIKNVCGSHQSLWVCSREFYLPELLISLQSEVDGNCQLKRESWGQNNVDGREKITGFARVPTCRVF